MSIAALQKREATDEVQNSLHTHPGAEQVGSDSSAAKVHDTFSVYVVQFQRHNRHEKENPQHPGSPGTEQQSLGH